MNAVTIIQCNTRLLIIGFSKLIFILIIVYLYIVLMNIVRVISKCVCDFYLISFI
jgi:hypothetical protein